MVDVERVIDEAGLTNTYVREYVAHWAGVTGAERVEVVSASDDARLVQESLDAGEGAGDVVVPPAVLAEAVDDRELTRINTELGAIQVAVIDGDLAAAQAMATNDPFAQAGLFESVQIQPWNWVFNNPAA